MPREQLDRMLERKFIDTTKRRTQATPPHGDGSPEPRADSPPSRDDWAVIIAFLRQTDPRLLGRLVRRMVNHLSWQGVDEAQQLLTAAARRSGPADGAAEGDDNENRPTARVHLDLEGLSERIFELAEERLGDAELVAIVQRWIREDRAAFLLEALENPGIAFPQLAEHLQRFAREAIDEDRLSEPTRVALRVGLIRRLLSDEPTFVDVAKHHMRVDDFVDLVPRIISSPEGYGKLGGKSAGLIQAARIIERCSERGETLRHVAWPRTKYLTSDTIESFIKFNQLQDAYDQRYMEIEQIRREYPHIVQMFKNSAFPPEVARELQAALDDLGPVPLVIRSSSLLEDRYGAAFSGKYKSLFVANQGTRAERLSALMDAIAEVYASVLGPDPIEYRAERNLLDVHEQMGIMIQEVVGRNVGPYFLPAYAGVAFSRNEFRWSPRIRRDDGLVRLVPGLGTRAVDRTGNDYPVLAAPGQPGLRVNATVEEAIRYAPRSIDVINVESRQFETLDVVTLIREHGHDFPALQNIVSVFEDRRLRPLTPLDDLRKATTVVSFHGLLSDTPFLGRLRAVLRVLEDAIGSPVDIEFASDGETLFLLQCRPQSYAEQDAPAIIPRDLPPDRVVFTARRYVSNGRVPDITHLVYVVPEEYSRLSTEEQLLRVARAVGTLNRVLPRERFILMGPGRWGSRGDVRLGVRVSYADISNAAVLIEVARRRGNYVPDLSFGTHFFQDLVESGIKYLPLFPDDGGVVFNEQFLLESPNALATLTPQFADLAHAVRVIDVAEAADGAVLRVLMNADLDEAIAFLA